jgi:hypothetical protein
VRRARANQWLAECLRRLLIYDLILTVKRGNMKKLALALTLAISLSAAASNAWKQEPTKFRGVPFGASKATFEKIITAPRCMQDEDDRNRVECLVDSLSPFLKASFTFDRDHLVAVIVTFESTNFGLTQTFVDKFGEPHTKMNGTCWWSGDRVSI